MKVVCGGIRFTILTKCIKICISIMVEWRLIFVGFFIGGYLVPKRRSLTHYLGKQDEKKKD